MHREQWYAPDDQDAVKFLDSKAYKALEGAFKLYLCTKHKGMIEHTTSM